MFIFVLMKVSKGIQIPKNNRGKPPKYPWAELKVGDSFFVKGIEKKHIMYSCLASYNKNKAKKPIKITLRVEGDGIRVWRIK